MNCSFPRHARTAIAALACAAAPLAMADVIHETNSPFGGFLGINGFDVFERQSVAARFEPSGDFTLDRVSLWLWNNDDSGGTPEIVISLRTDNTANGESRPSDVILESWTYQLPNTGVFQPTFFDFDSVLRPGVEQGQRYWIVAESPFALGGMDPVWAWAANESGWGSLVDPQSGEGWYDASTGAVSAMTVLGTPATTVVGDIDGDGDVDISDLAILLSSFGSCEGDPGFNAGADFDNTGCVELSDLATLLANFGS